MIWRLLLALTIAAANRAALAQTSLCRAAIANAEAGTRIPDAFLYAIGRVESGRPAAAGDVAPWPWTINAQGQGHFYTSKAEAIAAVQALQAQGVRSIDVGCLQVNLMHHPEAFASLDQAFDPIANAAYAARLLQSLFRQTGSWPRAAAAYHSQTPAIGREYQARVLEAWAIPAWGGANGDGPPAPPPPRPPAPAFAVPGPASPAIGAGPAAGFARILRLPAAGIPAAMGRDLAAYRRMPIRLATVVRPR